MPVKSTNGANTITESMLLPHLLGKRNRGGAVYSTISGTNSNLIETITLGETVPYGVAIAVGSNGKGFIASSVASDNKSAYAICVQGGVLNDVVKIVRLGDADIPGASFIANKVVWLSSGSPNLSTNLPACYSGDRKQRLGIALSPTKFFVTIETSSIIE